MKKILATAAVAALFATPAFAQEKSNFGGIKVGALVGYDSVSVEIDDEDGSKDGVLYGITAGYDADLGSAIVGVEAEVSDSSTKQRAFDLLVLGDSAKLSAGRDLYIGARAGFVVNPTLMVYAKAGYTNARAKLSYDDGDGFGFSGSDELDGYRLGAGLEYAHQSGYFARLEYRYSDYGNYKYDGFDTGISASRHQVAVTGGFRF